MATTDKTPADKTATQKVKKAPVAVVQRVTEQLKAAALRGKITADELDVIANLSGALKTFIKA